MMGLRTLADYIKNSNVSPVAIPNLELPAHVDPDSVAIFNDTFGNSYECYINHTIHNGCVNVTFYDFILGGGTWQTVTVPASQIELIDFDRIEMYIGEIL
ncbi:hypothetical protein KC887_02560 [Candidatus Kaiserbacteria bacterium]|nr:hypothetical protein [Candidatus Kaiserbacteria bacterium]